jgi:hypothetical protein
MEKRQHARYQPKEKTYLVFRPGFQTLGEIRDISQGGVCLDCITDKDFSKDEDCLIDIFLSNGAFNLAKLKGKVVRDTVVEETKTLSPPMITRRLALQFGELLPLQQVALASFIAAQKEGHA